MSKLDKIEELQRLIQQDPEDFQIRRELAVLLMDCGFNEEALQHLLFLSKNSATTKEFSIILVLFMKK